MFDELCRRSRSFVRACFFHESACSGAAMLLHMVRPTVCSHCESLFAQNVYQSDHIGSTAHYTYDISYSPPVNDIIYSYYYSSVVEIGRCAMPIEFMVVIELIEVRDRGVYRKCCWSNDTLSP